MKKDIPLELEYKIFGLVAEWFVNKWRNKADIFEKRTAINEKILSDIEEKKIELSFIPFEHENKEINELVGNIFNELIYPEPYLTRILIHNSIPPEDYTIRENIRKLLPKKELSYIKDFLHSAEVKLKDGQVVRIGYFVVGKVLKYLLSYYDHYKDIDQVKTAGDKETVEELRKRVYKNGKWTVYDYSPHYKWYYGDKEIVFEVFDDKVFIDLVKSMPLDIDDILSLHIKSESPLIRNFIFGKKIDLSETRLIIKYKDKEKEIPLQLLPKYCHKIMSAQNKLAAIFEGAKTEVLQVAMEAIFEGAKTWDRKKGASTNWIAGKIDKGVLQHHRDEHTKQIDNKRVNRRDVELTTLNAPITDGNTINCVDTLKSEAPTPEEELIFKEELTEKSKTLANIYAKQPKVKCIVEKEERGETLTANERKIKERAIKKYKKA